MLPDAPIGFPCDRNTSRSQAPHAVLAPRPVFALFCCLHPPELEDRNGADSSSLAFVLGKAWVAPRLLGVDAVAFSAGQFADSHLIRLGSAFDTAVTGGGHVVV